MSYYLCTYHNAYLGGTQKIVVPTIGDVMNGFWINGDHEFTKLSDNLFWIPPSQLILVSKIS